MVELHGGPLDGYQAVVNTADPDPGTALTSRTAGTPAAAAGTGRTNTVYAPSRPSATVTVITCRPIRVRRHGARRW